MECPKCHVMNPDGKKFCRECGAKLTFLCPQCAAELSPGDKFCCECVQFLQLPSTPTPKGLSIDEKISEIQRYLPQGLTDKILSQRERIEGEKKLVTVLLCDLEEFTALSERLGPEEMYGLMDAGSEWASTNQRVSDGHARKATEIPVSGPQFSDPVETAERCDARVVDLRAGDPPFLQGTPQLRPVTVGLGHKDQTGGFEPCRYLIDRHGERRRRRVNSRVGHDGQELVETRPGNAPRGSPFCQFGDPVVGDVMPRRVLPMGVNEQVGVESDHPPRPSYAISRVFSQEAPDTPGCSPLPLNVALRSRKAFALLRWLRTCRRPCSTMARTVVPSRAAMLRASCNSAFGISTVVFIHQYVSGYM
jgi:hypothetical protein